MALTGVHIVFSSVNAASGPTSLPLGATASQTMATAATSTISAPTGPAPLLSISASAPIYYALGANPDPSGSGSYPRRYYDPALGREDIIANAGDKFAWIFA